MNREEAARLVPGDRVVYTGGDPVYHDQHCIGCTGTIESPPAAGVDHVYVKWDGGGLRRPSHGVLIRNISLIHHVPTIKETTMRQFKVGDRVKVVKQCGASWNPDTMNRTIGKEGVVETIYGSAGGREGGIAVLVDGERSTWSYYADALSLVWSRDPLSVGDRVIYVGNTTGADVTSSSRGRTGTVEKLELKSAQIKWDDGRATNRIPFLHNLAKLAATKPDEAAIEAALAVLKAAGDVTFKPRKPPFTPITVRLNNSHAASVTDKEVKVGCQTFTFDTVVVLAAAVAKARAYAEQ